MSKMQIFFSVCALVLASLSHGFYILPMKVMNQQKRGLSLGMSLQDDFDEYNEHLPKFMQAGLAPRQNPDFPQKLRKQYKTMFGGGQLAPGQRRVGPSANAELNAELEELNLEIQENTEKFQYFANPRLKSTSAGLTSPYDLTFGINEFTVSTPSTRWGSREKM